MFVHFNKTEQLPECAAIFKYRPLNFGKMRQVLLSLLTVLEQRNDCLFQFDPNPVHCKIYRQFPYADRMWQATLRYEPTSIRIRLPIDRTSGQPNILECQEFITLILRQIAFCLFDSVMLKIENDVDTEITNIYIKDSASCNSVTLSFEYGTPIDWEPGTGTSYSNVDILKKFKKYLSPASISKALAAAPSHDPAIGQRTDA